MKRTATTTLTGQISMIIMTHLHQTTLTYQTNLAQQLFKIGKSVHTMLEA